ncbi:MAG: sporulation initiation factor Spo0A C-terminal domain-containing protein [Lachnospirales bacterium]
MQMKLYVNQEDDNVKKNFSQLVFEPASERLVKNTSLSDYNMYSQEYEFMKNSSATKYKNINTTENHIISFIYSNVSDTSSYFKLKYIYYKINNNEPANSNFTPYINVNTPESFLKIANFKSTLLGYKFLVTAISYCLQHNNIDNLKITKDIYPHIAQVHKVKIQCIERNLRHSISTTFKNKNTSIYYFLLNIPEEKSSSPSNSEFIYAVSKFLQKNSQITFPQVRD